MRLDQNRVSGCGTILFIPSESCADLKPPETTCRPSSPRARTISPFPLDQKLRTPVAQCIDPISDRNRRLVARGEVAYAASGDQPSSTTAKMFFCILFTGLRGLRLTGMYVRLTANLGRLSHFGANDFPFAGFVFLDSRQQCCALPVGSVQMLVQTSCSEPYLIFGEVGIVHVLMHFEFGVCTWTSVAYLVPVLLHTPFCSVGERLAPSPRQSGTTRVRNRSSLFLSHSSCSLRHASSSAAAPQRGSKVYWSCSSSVLALE